jgi:uncharacterized protein YndB with AHSA1/START domain
MTSNDIRDAGAGTASGTEAEADQTAEFTVTRVFDAPRDMVFAAFFDPAQLAQFWGPEGVHTPVDSIVTEARVGGRFVNTMVADDGSWESTMNATIVDFVEPERFTFRVDDGGIESRSTFVDLGDGRTEVTIHQVNVPVAFLTEEAQAGFRSSLDKFERFLAQAQQ